MLRSLPNILTTLRLICALALISIINFTNNNVWIFYIFTLGALTDWLDGYIAKNYNLSSRLGEVIDPIADKVLVISALMVLMHLDQSLALLTASAIMIIREFVISAMRQLLSEMSFNPLKVTFLSRIKATTQMLGIGFCMFANAYVYQPFYNIGLALIIISAMLTIITLCKYCVRAKDLIPNI